MRLDTQPLLLAAARLALAGHLDLKELEERRSAISVLEGRIVTRELHVAAYEETRARLEMDGTSLAWGRWRAEQQGLAQARADVERMECQLRFEVERLEHEVALARQRQARALSGQKAVLA